MIIIVSSHKTSFMGYFSDEDGGFISEAEIYNYLFTEPLFTFQALIKYFVTNLYRTMSVTGHLFHGLHLLSVPTIGRKRQTKSLAIQTPVIFWKVYVFNYIRIQSFTHSHKHLKIILAFRFHSNCLVVF